MAVTDNKNPRERGGKGSATLMIDPDRLKEAAMPLMQLLKAECHPHCAVIVTGESAKLVVDEVFVLTGDEESVKPVMVEPLSPKTSWMDKLADEISRQILGEANRDIPSK